MAQRRVRTETAARHDLVRVCAFVGIVLAAVLFVVGAILNWCGLGQVTSILNLIAQITLLVAVAIPAWEFARVRSRAWQVVYWVALFFYAFGVVFGMVKMFI